MSDSGLRSGFTTGTCAAAAAKGASYMLLSGRKLTDISVGTPAGKAFSALLLAVRKEEKSVSCAVKKDAGDDPDVTDGVLVFAKVSLDERDDGCAGGLPQVVIDGGEGIGRVTMPGLDQPVGAAAINSVPRQMIREAVEEVCRLFDHQGRLSVVISVPTGEAIAKRTMNGKLGIVGGISILGTTGVVAPMSAEALLAAIRLEIHQKKVLGAQVLPLAIGNYGKRFLQEQYGCDLDAFVKCSNFVGDAVWMAVDEGFEKVRLVGHIGKMVKLAGGKRNTHSKYGDCRMEQLASALIAAGGGAKTVRGVLGSVSTEEAIRWIEESGLLQPVMDVIMGKIMDTLNKIAYPKADVKCLVFSNGYGVLGMSDGFWCE